jgi:hypothetical protein
MEEHEEEDKHPIYDSTCEKKEKRKRKKKTKKSEKQKVRYTQRNNLFYVF